MREILGHSHADRGRAAILHLLRLRWHRLLLKLVRNIGKRLGGVTMNRGLRVDFHRGPLTEALLTCLLARVLILMNARVSLVH